MVNTINTTYTKWIIIKRVSQNCVEFAVNWLRNAVKLVKNVPQKHCLKYKENIKQFYGIDVTTDNSEIYMI